MRRTYMSINYFVLKIKPTNGGFINSSMAQLLSYKNETYFILDNNINILRVSSLVY